MMPRPICRISSSDHAATRRGGSSSSRVGSHSHRHASFGGDLREVDRDDPAVRRAFAARCLAEARASGARVAASREARAGTSVSPLS
jgi:hypothetical protein